MNERLKDFFTHSFLAGVASMSSQVIFHPLELIKTRFQSHDGQTRNLVPQYKNLFTAIKQIYQQEGFKGLYKGIFISIIAQTSARAIFFGNYEVFKRKYTEEYPFKKAVFFASLQSGIMTSIITQPLYVLKTNLLLNTQNQKGIQNIIHHSKLIYEEFGIKGFYRGLGVSCFLSIHGIIQLQIYESLQKSQKLKNILGESLMPLYSGLIAKGCSLTLLYPFSTIKVRLQEHQFIALDHQMKFQHYKDKKYQNIFDLVSKMIKNEGYLSFYKGYKINIIRQVPQQGFFFFFYEQFKKQQSKH